MDPSSSSSSVSRSYSPIGERKSVEKSSEENPVSEIAKNRIHSPKNSDSPPSPLGGRIRERRQSIGEWVDEDSIEKKAEELFQEIFDITDDQVNMMYKDLEDIQNNQRSRELLEKTAQPPAPLEKRGMEEVPVAPIPKRTLGDKIKAKIMKPVMALGKRAGDKMRKKAQVSKEGQEALQVKGRMVQFNRLLDNLEDPKMKLTIDKNGQLAATTGKGKAKDAEVLEKIFNDFDVAFASPDYRAEGGKMKLSDAFSKLRESPWFSQAMKGNDRLGEVYRDLEQKMERDSFANEMEEKLKQTEGVDVKECKRLITQLRASIRDNNSYQPPESQRIQDLRARILNILNT